MNKFYLTCLAVSCLFLWFAWQSKITAYHTSRPTVRIKNPEEYHLVARVLSVERYSTPPEVPLDMVLSWGPLDRGEVFKHLNISQHGRRFWWTASGGDMAILGAQDVVMASVANVHLIPADEVIQSELMRLLRGDRLGLDGELVDLVFPDGAIWRSSRSRTDVGDGSCEVFHVNFVQALR